MKVRKGKRTIEVPSKSSSNRWGLNWGKYLLIHKLEMQDLNSNDEVIKQIAKPPHYTEQSNFLTIKDEK